MSDAMYVECGPFTVKDIFDPKLKPNAVKSMNVAAGKVLGKNSDYTTKKPSDKDAQGLFVGGTAVSITKTASGNQVTIEVKLSLQVGFWPGHEIKSMATGGAKASGGASGKIEDLLDDAVGGAMEALMRDKVMKELDREAKLDRVKK